MMTLSQLAPLLGAEVHCAAADSVVTGVSSIEQAAPGSLVFAQDETSFAAAMASSAAAVLVSSPVAGPIAENRGAGGKAILLVAQPRLAFARAARLLRAPQRSLSIHPTAVLGADVHLAEDVSIGAYAVLGDGVCAGSGTTIGSGAIVGAGVVLGSDCHVYPRVVIYPGTTLGDRVIIHAGAVLGADGFGYVRDEATGEYLQFPQQGVLVIEDDVEIGANTTIDRGALKETRIARGAKIDNLVHIGHNVCVGRNIVIAAQTGISGSCVVEDDVVLGGQVGIGDHALIGRGVILGGQGGILPRKKIHGPGELFWGTPARPVKEYLKELAVLARLSSSSNPRPRSRDNLRRATDSPRESASETKPGEE